MISNQSGRVRNLHPFPARMAPDVALEKIDELSDPGDVVLDPMCGSGTVPRLAGASGRKAIASDVDPLAILMTRTACKPNISKNLEMRAEDLVKKAKRLGSALPQWIQKDQETMDFSAYWFAGDQRRDLSRLARVLEGMPKSADPLRLSLSKLIVTKSGGASLARDTSHSRPHRVTTENDFDVFAEFIKSAGKLEKTLGEQTFLGRASVRSADARTLGFIKPASVDLIITSPPYLNAIDYLRGHKMSLIWLGWSLARIRALRSDSIGAEKKLKVTPIDISRVSRLAIPEIDSLPQRDQSIIWRFAHDMDRLCSSFSRVSKPGGHLVFVVADSTLKGVNVSNSALVTHASRKYDYELQEILIRQIPMQHRYLPPPETDSGALGARMREEKVLTFRKNS